jgi:predicted transcriptional regulator
MPSIENVENSKDVFEESKCSIYVCALGFEDRCLSYSEYFISNSISVDRSIIFEYSTNTNENNTNKEVLVETLSSFTKTPIEDIVVDFNSNFSEFKGIIEELLLVNETVTAYVDISVFSGVLIYSVISTIFEFENVELVILYAEASQYAPYDNNIDLRKANSTGQGDTFFPGKDNPGKKDVPPYLITVPTFNYDRTLAIIAEYFDSLQDDYVKIDDIHWIIGMPNMPHDDQCKRIQLLKDINNISSDNISYVKTLSYTEIILRIEELYKEQHENRQIVLASHGSKLQSLGVTMYSQMRPDITVCHALPKEYLAESYSSGCKTLHCINFGLIRELKKTIFELDRLLIL